MLILFNNGYLAFKLYEKEKSRCEFKARGGESYFSRTSKCKCWWTSGKDSDKPYRPIVEYLPIEYNYDCPEYFSTNNQPFVTWNDAIQNNLNFCIFRRQRLRGTGKSERNGSGHWRKASTRTCRARDRFDVGISAEIVRVVSVA